MASKMVSEHALENLLSIMGEPPISIPRELKTAEQQLGYLVHRSTVSVTQIDLGPHWQEQQNGYYLAETEYGMTALLPYGMNGYVFYDESLQSFQRVDRKNEARFRNKVWEITPSLPTAQTSLTRFACQFIFKQSRSEVKWMMILTAVLLCCAFQIAELCQDALWNVVHSEQLLLPYSMKLAFFLICGGAFSVMLVKLLQRVCERADLLYSTAATSCLLRRKPWYERKALKACFAICMNPCGKTVRFLFLSAFSIISIVFAIVLTEYRICTCLIFALSALVLGIQKIALARRIPHRMENTLILHTAGQAWLRQMELEKDLPEDDPILPSGKHKESCAFGDTIAIVTLLISALFLIGTVNGMGAASLFEYGVLLGPALFCMLQLYENVPEFLTVLYCEKTILREMTESKVQDLRPSMLHCDGTLLFDHVRGEHLKTLSMQVAQGEKIGIYGVAGSGKTAILKMIAGLLPMQYGSIYSSGYDSAQVEGRSWRKFVRLIRKAEPSQIVKAVQEGAAILLLDQVSDAEIAKQLGKLSQTCIMTSSRKTWLTGCDRLFRLENGTLIPEGREVYGEERIQTLETTEKEFSTIQ